MKPLPPSAGTTEFVLIRKIAGCASTRSDVDTDAAAGIAQFWLNAMLFQARLSSEPR